MSDKIKHECGIALIRLRKPLSYYKEKYGTALYGLNALYLMLQKQHNRGQDGAGIASIKLNAKPGKKFLYRKRSTEQQPIMDIFNQIFAQLAKKEKQNPKKFGNPKWLKNEIPALGELMMGHLRYGTYGKNKIGFCHPVRRANNWITRNLVLAGNFNLTNVDELFQLLIEIGQHPVEKSDTVTVLEKFGHFLDDEVQTIYDKYQKQGLQKSEITELIASELDIVKILKRSTQDFDGGYVIEGLMGHGDAFVVRDPNGIRPCYYYVDDEIAIVASERPAIQTTFNLPTDSVKELPPGNAIIIKNNGAVSIEEILPARERKSCSFERIYFSRGTDQDIYRERIQLGVNLTPQVIEAIDNDIENTVFSFIPNTAEVSFYGLLKGIEAHIRTERKEAIRNQSNLTSKALDKLLYLRPRVEKIAIKDAKLRTFITDDSSRDQLVSHIYDITYGTIRPHLDTLVIVDDSIVRGTTLKMSILSILDRLNPKKIVVVSSAPQIRFPDCYGIDMSKIGDFVAFKAIIALIKEADNADLLQQTYENCLGELKKDKKDMVNRVKDLFIPYSVDEISAKIAQIVTPPNMNAEVQVIYQGIANLHKAIPNHQGDWYFTGNYPTPGGNKVVNQAYVNFYEGKDGRAY